MGFSWLLLTVGVGIKATEFQIDTDTPDALCPELSMTRDAVKTRLGQLEVEGGGTWRGRYTTIHDPAGRRGDYLRLAIVDPAGREQASRELPMQGESCSTLAQAIALVVDGFFRDFGQSPPRDTVPAEPPAKGSKWEPTPTANATSTTKLKTNPETPSSAAPRAEPQPEPAEPRGRVGLIVGNGYERDPSSAAAVLGLYVAATPRWRIDLKSAFPTARTSQTYGGATAYLYPIPLRLSLSYLMPSYHRVSWFVGPEFLVSFEHASTKGVSDGHSGWRASLGLGGRTGVAYWLLPWLAVAGNVSANALMYESRRFLMFDTPVLEVSHARLAGTLEVWGAFFP
jgi:hypothetical protein